MQSLPWDELQDFLAVALTRQINRAAEKLGVNPTTVGRRLRRLEMRLGQTLFEQTIAGQVLTADGERLLRHVEVMERSANRIVETTRSVRGLSGVLRVSVAEGFGTWFIARHLQSFVVKHPELTVELVATTGFLSPSRRETDMAIMLARPQGGPVVSSKLTDYALAFYASADRIALGDLPSKLSDLDQNTRLVGYVPDLLYAPELDYLTDLNGGLRASLRSSSINAQHQMIAAGLGIGILPEFIGASDPALRSLLPELNLRRSFWLVTHRETRRLERVKVFRNWLLDLVAEKRALLLNTHSNVSDNISTVLITDQNDEADQPDDPDLFDRKSDP